MKYDALLKTITSFISFFFKKSKPSSKNFIQSTSVFGGTTTNNSTGEVLINSGVINGTVTINIFGNLTQNLPSIEKDDLHYFSQPTNLSCIVPPIIEKPRIDFDARNTFFAKFGLPSHQFNGNWGLAFYSIKIINTTPVPFTVKDLHLRYTIANEKFCKNSDVIMTATINSPLDKQEVNAAIVTNGAKKIILMGWDNLRAKINCHHIIQPGGVLSGSAYFILNFKEYEKLQHLKDIEIFLNNYSGGESVHGIKIEKEMIDNNVNTILQNQRELCIALENEIKVQSDQDVT